MPDLRGVTASHLGAKPEFVPNPTQVRPKKIGRTRSPSRTPKSNACANAGNSAAAKFSFRASTYLGEMLPNKFSFLIVRFPLDSRCEFMQHIRRAKILPPRLRRVKRATEVEILVILVDILDFQH